MGKEIKYFWLKVGSGMLVAARPEIDDVVVFNEKEKKWRHASRAYSIMEGDLAYDGGPDFIEISEEEAQNIFKDVQPDFVYEDTLTNLE